MKALFNRTWVFAFLCFLGACSGSAATDTTASTTTTTSTTTPANPPGPAAETGDEAGEDSTTTTNAGDDIVRTIELDLSEAQTYDSGSGVTLSIDDVRVGDLTSLPPDMAEDMEPALEDPNNQSLLILTITVENQGDAPVGFFPDQGTALIGSEQVTANFFLSESFTGGSSTILDGASVTKDVYFELPQSADEVGDLGAARFTADGPFDDETFESVGSEVDITVTWTR